MNMNIRILLILLLSGQIAIAQKNNQYQWKIVSNGGYTYKTVIGDPMKARFYTLSNGLTVILSVNKKEPKIQCQVAVRAGSNNDPHDHTGLAHYLEHLMFKGTDQYGTLDWAKEKPLLDQIDSLYEKYNHTTDTALRAAIYRDIDKTSGEAAKYAIANEYDKMLSGMGAEATNAMTFMEYTGYTDMIPSNAVDKYLAVQAERFRNPVFRLFHTELEAVYEEKNTTLDSDPDKVFERLYASLFPTSNYGQQTTIGTIEHLKNPSQEAIRKFYDEHYVPNNMAIIMAGDMDPDSVIKKIDHSFNYMQPKPVEVYTSPVELPIAAPIYKEVFGPDAENITIGYRLPGATDAHSYALMTTLSALLYNGKAGLIDINLNKGQTVLSAQAEVDPYRDYSVFTLTAKPKTGQSLEDVRDLLLAQIEKIKRGDFDESLIKATVANYKLSRMEQLENNRSRADALFDGFVLDKGGSWDLRASLLDSISILTKQELVDFVNKYFDNNYVCIYKRIGEDKDVIKVTKPPITPVFVNHDAQSDFLKKVSAMPVTSIKPQWIDFNKDLTKTKLGNTTLLYARNKDNDIFQLNYRFPMGTYNDRLLAIAVQYLQYLGTHKMNSENISRRFYNLACSYSINVGGEFTTINIWGLQENMTKAASLLEDLLRHCQVDDTAWLTLKERMLKGRADSKLNQHSILSALSYYAMYGAKNPFNNQFTNDELTALKPDSIVDLLHGLLKYEHIITYYGPLSLPQAIAGISKVHQLPAVFKEHTSGNEYVKIKQDTSRILFVDYDIVQAKVEWVRNTRDFDPLYEPTVEVFNEYYNGDMSAVVFQTLRESKALAYSVFANYYTPLKKKDKYTMVGYVGCQADKLNDAIAGMNELLDSVPLSDKGLLLAKESLKKSYQTTRYTGQDIIDEYLADKRLGLPRDIRKEVYDDIDKIGFRELQQFDTENIANKPFAYCLLASSNKINMNELKKYGGIKKLSLNELFGY
jgi:predicted Zn-dependent peptidase